MAHKCPDKRREYQREYYRRNREKKLRTSKTRYELRALVSPVLPSECPQYMEMRKAAFVAKRREAGRLRRESWSYAERSARSNIAYARRRSSLERDDLFGGKAFDDVLSFTMSLVEERVRLTKRTGVEHHIDHIRPLSKGGMHIPENLRVIPAAENLSKNDWWHGEYENLSNEESDQLDQEAIRFSEKLMKGKSYDPA